MNEFMNYFRAAKIIMNLKYMVSFVLPQREKSSFIALMIHLIMMRPELTMLVVVRWCYLTLTMA